MGNYNLVAKGLADDTPVGHGNGRAARNYSLHQQRLEQQHAVRLALLEYLLALGKNPVLDVQDLSCAVFCARYCTTLRMSGRPSPSSSWVN